MAQYAPYAEYQEKTDREIPVFLLEPVERVAARFRTGSRRASEAASETRWPSRASSESTNSGPPRRPRR